MSSTGGILKGHKYNFQKKLLHRFIDDIAEKFPKRSALIFEGTEKEDPDEMMTFVKLYETSNRVTRALLALFDKNKLTVNTNGSWIIGIQMKPSVNVIVTMLAIWKCGAAYWPINPFYNRKRIQKILTEVKPQLLIIDDDCENSKFFQGFLVIKFSALMKMAMSFESSYVIDDLSFSLGKDCEAITIYTSGTLKEPKGTVLLHSCCQQRLEWQWKTFPFDSNENCCMARNTLFHIDHFSEIWGALCAGKCLVIVKNEFRKDPEQLTRIMEKFDIKRFTALPSTINEIVSFLLEKEPRMEVNVRLWMSTGEPLTIQVANNFFTLFTEGDQKLVNCFGCTETIGECAWFSIESKEQLDQLEGAEIPLGCPTFNTFIYVMDHKLSPTTELGEIFISGEFLAQYYVHENEESQTIFHNHLTLMPAHTRLFRTKDYGVLRNGFLYHRGRVGRMLRIDENLIDLSAIENFLASLKFITNAAVMMKKNDNFQLLAFVSLARSFAYMTNEEIKEALDEELPSYLESEVVILNEIPKAFAGNSADYEQLLIKYDDLTTKLRESRIVNLNVDGFDFDDQEFASKVLRIVGECIGPSRGFISAESNFFEIGGNSLNVMQTVAQLTDSQLPISTIDFLRSNNMLDLVEKIKKSRNVKVNLSLDPNSNINIAPISEKDMEECANLLATCYYKKNTLTKFTSELRSENIYNFLKANWKFFVDKDLSFKVVDKEDKILGVSINYERAEENLLEMNELQAMDPIMEYIGFVENNLIKLQFSQNPVITPFMMGTSLDLDPEDNVRIIFMMENHLLKLLEDKNFRAIVSINACPLNTQINKSINGYKTVKEFPANRFINKKGQRPFQQADDNVRACVQVYENNKMK